MSKAILRGHVIKPIVLKDDKRGVPSVSFTLKDDNGHDWYPCFAEGAVARALHTKVKVDDTMDLICDIASKPDTSCKGVSSRVAFKVLTFDKR